MLLRRFAIASTLVIAGSILATPAMANQTVEIDGDVTATTVLRMPDVTDLGEALNLGGIGAAASSVTVHVIDITVFSNEGRTVNLTVDADNSLSNNTDSVAYSVAVVGDGADEPTSGFSNAANGVVVPILPGDFNTTSGEASKDVYIQYTAPARLSPGNYTSSITVSITPL
jgi:hypothetical protein